MYIKHKPNEWVDKQSGKCCFTPDWQADYEQIQRLRPGATLHKLRDTALLVVDKGEMTLDRQAILRQFIAAADGKKVEDS